MKTISLPTRIRAVSAPGAIAAKLCRSCFELFLASPLFAGNLAGRYATITLDGSLSDWVPSDTMYSASEIGTGAPANTTFTNVSVANDSV